MKKDSFDLFFETLDKFEKAYPKTFNFIGYSILFLSFISGAIAFFYALLH